MLRVYNETVNKMENILKGHEDAVQDVKFDYNSKMIVSCGSDSTFRVWQ
jgi:WD40 repeat protein